MNAKGDANRSVRQTKQRLYEALIHLLQQKSLREITVRELTELAGISRGTFYFHYADIYALMEQMESVQLARLESLMDNLIPNISREDVPPGILPGYDAAKAAVYRKGQQILLALGAAAVGLQLP